MQLTENNKLTVFSHQRFEKELERKEFLYRSRLSFSPLIRYWEKSLESGNAAEMLLASEILKKIEQYPEWDAPISSDNFHLLKENSELLELLLSGLFPPALKYSQVASAFTPFKMDAIFHTPRFNEIFNREDTFVSFTENVELINKFKIINAGLMILNEFYDQNFHIDNPYVLSLKDSISGIERHYKLDLISDYVDIINIHPLKELSQDDILRLIAHLDDVEIWKEMVPPENFEFQGITIINFTDVTEDESISRLKYSLLEKDAVLSREKLSKLEFQLRNIFQMPDLQLGIAALSYDPDTGLYIEKNLINSIISSDNKNLNLDWKNSLYMKVFEEGRIVLAENLIAHCNGAACELALMEKQIRSLILSPLKDHDNKIVGLLELGSPKPRELNNLLVAKLEKLLPIFSVAVQRSKKEIENKVEVIIKEKCTAIHPSVQWRFEEAAKNLLNRQVADPMASELEPIVFKDVNPLYGQADIVASSKMRNRSIQADLMKNLELVLGVLKQVENRAGYPLIGDYEFQVNSMQDQIRDGLNSGDEVRIVEFLKKQIEPLFSHLERHNPAISDSIQRYHSFKDDFLGIVYASRKDYEDSVALINETISAYIVEQEHVAQQILPHYFEKYQTDGVEYNLYVGQSLLKNKDFDCKYLENLQLWQLILMCEITKIVADLQPHLKVPLTTAQMILVHSTPLSIRFRPEEKQFDVDGTYNVRYEIIKKRVDKALVAGTKERFTQPGKVAIVYSHEKDKFLYLRYAEYLKNSGYITDEIEDLELDALQGVSGLKGLRFTVKIPKKFTPDIVTTPYHEIILNAET